MTPGHVTWLETLPIKPTLKGVKVETLRIYVYPDGHGNIDYPGNDQGAVNNAEEAVRLLRAMWERMQVAAQQNKTETP